MKKFIKIMAVLLVVVPCMLVMVACDKVSATDEVPPIMDQPVVIGPAPEEPGEVEDPVVDPVVPADEYQEVNNQAEFAALLADAQGTTYVRLNKNMIFRTPLIINTRVVLDLNGKTILNNQNIRQDDENIWSLISIRNNGNLIINGEGQFQTKENDCFVIDLQGEHTRCTINGGTFIGNTTTIYVKQGRLTVNGGTFKIQSTTADKGYGYVLDCDDENYQNGMARIWVQGGKFNNFNPAVCGAESEANDATNFVTQGYQGVVAKVVYKENAADVDNTIVYNPSQELIAQIKAANSQIDIIYTVVEAPVAEVTDQAVAKEDDNNGLIVVWPNR